MSGAARGGRGAKALAADGAPAPLIVKILVALGGFAALAIALEGARSWSWWANGVLAGQDVGGLPAAPELFVYPVFFSVILAFARPAPRTGTAVFLLFGMLWSGAMFLADPAMRGAVHAAAPDLQDSEIIERFRVALLYVLLFIWLFRTYRRLFPRNAAPKAKPKSGGGRTAKAGSGNGNSA